MSEFPGTNRMLLVILDGWGFSERTEDNAIIKGRTPNFDSIIDRYPYRLIEASGEHVGLPEGQMGNSEVGHLTLGAGRIIYQPLVRITKAIDDGDVKNNRELLNGMEKVLENDSTLHLMGLTSYGGVHSHISHLYGLLEMALDQGIERIRVHVITDGRDVPPDSSIDDIKELTEWIFVNDPKERIKVATIMGRFYAMDRDRRWDRTQHAFKHYIIPMESQHHDPVGAIENAYGKDETDEFISPVQIIGDDGEPIGLVRDDDTLIFFNFRPDRARQMTKAFIYPYFDGFIRPKVVRPYFVAMTDYDDTIFTHVAFPEIKVTDTLGKIISDAGLRQLRIAETEKYAHVTFFFSGGREDTFKGEYRILVPSPKVRTYDLEPEMSARAILKEMGSQIDERSFDFGILNFANPDMVGHTGKMDAAVKAVETVDSCLGPLLEKAVSNGYQLIITADHGNVEHMWNHEKNIPFTAHTTNPVYMILAGEGITKEHELRGGGGTIADIAPTILKQMGIPKPKSMTGKPFT